MARKLYILNSPITPIKDGNKCVIVVKRTKDIDYVKKFTDFLKNKLGFEVISAIGHQTTAQVLSKLLGFEVPAQRISVEFDKGDVAIAFALDFRLPEGKVLSDEELKRIIDERKFSFYIIDVANCIEGEGVTLHVI
ncbi:MAG: DUF1874 domain-containing protein [Thaumarchaeota archaeon]|nr:DUF1874 domain-containing protein [Candidatus Geocrenenecus arthurdayi]